MSRESTAVLNVQLTNFATGLMNDLMDVEALPQRLAPFTPVPGTTGQYKKFDDVNSFQTYATERALGGDPKRITFEASDGTFNCKPHALEVTIDKEERRAAGDGDPVAQMLLDQGKVKSLINGALLSRAVRVVNAVVAATAATGGMGNWSNPDIDPIDQLDELLDTLTKSVGSTQNIKLDMDVTAWRLLRNHPKVKARTGGVQVGGIRREQLNDLLMLPVDFKVSSIVYNTAALGQSQSKSRVLGSQVLLYYSVPNATLYDPSAFKTFIAGGNTIQSVRSYASPNGFWDGHVVDWSEQIVNTSTVAIKRVVVS